MNYPWEGNSYYFQGVLPLGIMSVGGGSASFVEANSIIRSGDYLFVTRSEGSMSGLRLEHIAKEVAEDLTGGESQQTADANDE